MSRQFSIQRGPVRVVFGAGSLARLADEVAALGAARVAVISTPGRRSDAEAVAARLGSRAAGVVALAREHVPIETVEAAARAIGAADAALGFGGGSALGLAKALALRVPVRVIAVPTTYSGSEMTSIYGVTEGGAKRTGKDERVRPALVVYDPELTVGLPVAVSVTSLWNAIAHAVEALWAEGVTATTASEAETSLGLLAASVPRVIADPADVDARAVALEGAYLAGAALAAAGTGPHHKLCHVLGGSFGLPHAATHAVVLPHVVAAIGDAAPAATAAIARALGAADAVTGLTELAAVGGGPRSLAELGLAADQLDRAADLAAAVMPAHPRRLDRAALRDLLGHAHAGA